MQYYVRIIIPLSISITFIIIEALLISSLKINTKHYFKNQLLIWGFKVIMY